MFANGSSDALPPNDTKRHYAMGRKTAASKSSPSVPAGSATVVGQRDLSKLLTEEEQLQEEQLVRLLAGFLSDAESEDSVAAPLAAAVTRMQARMQEMNTFLSSSNSSCLKDIKQTSFARTAASAPTTSTAEKLLATACNLIIEAQSAFVYGQNELMTAVADAVGRAAKQNYVVLRHSAERTNDLQREIRQLKTSMSSLANEVNELRVTMSEMRASMEALELRFSRERPAVSTVPEELLRGRGYQRSNTMSNPVLRLRSASRASSCDSASSTRTQISMARSAARSRRPSMGPAVQFDPPFNDVLHAFLTPPRHVYPQPEQHLQQWQNAYSSLLVPHSTVAHYGAGLEFPGQGPLLPMGLEPMLPQRMLQQDGQQMSQSVQIPAYLPSTYPHVQMP
jgi:hypothetical protein